MPKLFVTKEGEGGRYTTYRQGDRKTDRKTDRKRVKASNWFLTPNQPGRSYQGSTNCTSTKPNS